ncbi:MAG: Stk1 family PASTA domain-containing Ser/Thr kinase [Clostridia bacterium]|nr:Stk1 family PASTA domain-containing Ser/Thr kinase [Clostridia bacterium]
MEGKTLGNRYELLEKIGGGGMAIVYKAKCTLLNRFVAVKILRPEFVNDEEFVKRFRIEAQSAASLSHPNIVSIYDVGHEENIHYIVMEFIDGVTLKDYINQKKQLSWKESVKIAVQICSAIEHAHRNHIVHRDIKPHNILLTEQGIAKVTDFGIARAVSSSTITMVGSTIGSVHYFSPEQARGGYTDEKSDLYSLGIALYEMVTGKLPFDGETPVAIALKHIQQEAQQPLEIDENIPKGVNDIIMKAIKKDQNKRYQSATEMLNDMHRVLSEPDGSFVIQENQEDMPTRRVKAISSEDLSKKDEYKIKDEEKKKESKGDRLTVWLAVATSAIIIGLFTYIGYSFVYNFVKPDEATKKEIKVEDYTGKSIDTVREKLASAGIKVKEREKTNDKVEKGIILDQNVAVGNTLKPDGNIEFIVSSGPKMVKMIDLKKQDYRQASSKVTELGLVPRIEEEFNETLVAGLITRTSPEEGEEVKSGSEVVLYKSKGPEIKTTKVPDLKGKTRMEAQKALADAKLTLGKVFPEDSKNLTDKIVSQKPEAQSEINEGSPVDIYLETNTLARKIYSVSLALNNPDQYKDKIRVKVEVTPSDTNKTENLKDDEIEKSRFPLTLAIPVPENGTTSVVVYLDGSEFTRFVAP